MIRSISARLIQRRSFAYALPQKPAAPKDSRDNFVSWIVLSSLAGIGIYAYTKQDTNETVSHVTAHPDISIPQVTSTKRALYGPHFWGSNRYRVVQPSSNEIYIKEPTSLTLPNVTSPWRSLVLRETHAAAIDDKGRLFQWGTGYFEEKDNLQIQALDEIEFKVPVCTLSDMDFIKVEANEDYLLLLSSKGKAFVMPVKKSEQLDWETKLSTGFFSKMTTSALPIPVDNVSSIACGQHHATLLTKEGSVWTLPLDEHANDHGQLGRGDSLSEMLSYSLLQRNTLSMSGAESNDPRSMVDAILRDQMSPTDKMRLQQVEQERRSKVDKALDWMQRKVKWSRHAMLNAWQNGLTTDWNGNRMNMAGLGRVDVPRMKQVACGSLHTIGVTEDNRLYGFGSHFHGQLGLGLESVTKTRRDQSKILELLETAGKEDAMTLNERQFISQFFVTRPVLLEALTRAVQSSENIQLRMGPFTSHILTDHGVIATGLDLEGQLGLGGASHHARYSPVSIPSLQHFYYDDTVQCKKPIPIHDLSIGGAHGLALLETERGVQELYVWGKGNAYQLGHGKRGRVRQPESVVGVRMNAERVATGDSVSAVY